MSSQELGRLVFFGDLDYGEAFKGRIGSALFDDDFVAWHALIELIVHQQIRAHVFHPVVLAVDDLASHRHFDSLGGALCNNQRLGEACFPRGRHCGANGLPKVTLQRR